MKGRDLVCERCSKPFGCGVDDPGGCWCASVPLAPAQLDGLRRSYRDCLCGDCLREIAAQEKAGAETNSGRPG